MDNIILKRTNSEDKDFQKLIHQLDHELWNELNEDQSTYDQYNKVPGISTAIVAYVNAEPAASGCFKMIDDITVEIKRMYVRKEFRGTGLSKKVLKELEKWATENNFQQALLETSIHFTTAQQLYLSNGYTIIPNYPPYTGLDESVCMKKKLKN